MFFFVCVFAFDDENFQTFIGCFGQIKNMKFV